MESQHFPTRQNPKKALIQDLADKWEWWETAESRNNTTYYRLTEVKEFIDLSERLIIEWGGGTTSWVQKITDKPVVAILEPGPGSVAEFESYEATIFMLDDLVQIATNPMANQTWVKALKAVNGVYCVTDTRNGRIYVGSAYGKDGIWKRWLDYAKTGHGGNKLLIEFFTNEAEAGKYMQFCILEILPGNSTADDAIAKENLWKRKLGSRIGGYNDN